jgi:hypothetical protein
MSSAMADPDRVKRQLEIDLAHWLQDRLCIVLNDFTDRAQSAGLSTKWTSVAVNAALNELHALAAATSIAASADELAKHFEERVNHYRYRDGDRFGS